MDVFVLSPVRLCDPMDCVAFQAHLSMAFSRQEYWSGLPFPSPEGIFPTQGWNPLDTSCIGRQIFYPWHTWKVPSEGTELSNSRRGGRGPEAPQRAPSWEESSSGAQGSWLSLLTGETSGELQKPGFCFRDPGAGHTAWDRLRQGWTQGSAQS